MWHSAPVSDDHRTVTIERQALGRYTARNARGGEITLAAGEGSDFTPVELLLVAIAGCSGADVDYITAKRAEAEAFTVTVDADKVRDDQGMAPARCVGSRRLLDSHQGDVGRF